MSEQCDRCGDDAVFWFADEEFAYACSDNRCLLYAQEVARGPPEVGAHV